MVVLGDNVSSMSPDSALISNFVEKLFQFCLGVRFL